MDILEGFKVSSERVVMSTVPSSVSRAVKVCESLSPRELVITEQLAARVGISKAYMQGDVGNHPLLAPYRETVKNRYLWGNRRTIQKLRARKERLVNGH